MFQIGYSHGSLFILTFMCKNNRAYIYKIMK